MEFKDLLNQYCSTLKISQNDLTAASGLSAPVISRYLSGERRPNPGSEQLKALANGLASLTRKTQNQASDLDQDSILSSLEQSLRLKDEQFDRFVPNFNTLLECFDVKMKDLSAYLNFDISFLYRIRSGERRPAELDTFCRQIASFLIEKYQAPEDRYKAARLMNVSADELETKEAYQEQILQFLDSDSELLGQHPAISGLLNKLENFNLDEYIQAIHFYDIKIPTSPFRIPVSKTYYGIAQMRNAELDFFKITALGKSKNPVFLYSDMPMLEMAEDMEFNKKWMFGIAAILRKGLQINMIHNLDRPMEEMMLGLEAWIPIYMTGQVSPYYLPDYKNPLFKTLNYCSGNAALSAECIAGQPLNGKYHLSTQKQDIAYMQKRTDAILSAANPLMKIYTLPQTGEWRNFLEKQLYVQKASRHIITPDLPLFTMPQEMAESLLETVEDPFRPDVRVYFTFIKTAMEDLLAENVVNYDCHVMTPEEFKENPAEKKLPDLFIPAAGAYTYKQYLSHVEATYAYAASHNNFRFHENKEMTFRNISITIVSGRFFVVSKSRTPNIHFVIHHPKLLSAMECFTPPRRED